MRVLNHNRAESAIPLLKENWKVHTAVHQFGKASCRGVGKEDARTGDRGWVYQHTCLHGAILLRNPVEPAHRSSLRTGSHPRVQSV